MAVLNNMIFSYLKLKKTFKLVSQIDYQKLHKALKKIHCPISFRIFLKKFNINISKPRSMIIEKQAIVEAMTAIVAFRCTAQP